MNKLTEVKVGLLHSSSGTMAVSETPLVDAVQMAVDEINQDGGVLNRQIQIIVEDGASIPHIFADKAEKLLVEEGVATIFGCWTSSSRKAVKPVIERQKSLLWYPVQYEGLEESPNIIYTGSCLNQQIEPAVSWALAGGIRRCFLLGSDYVFPRIANHLITTLVAQGGGHVLEEQYVPLDSKDFAQTVTAIKDLQPDIIFNTINGEANLAFFRELARAELDSDSYPVMSFSFSEAELQSVIREAAGHYACWSYFQSLQTPENLEFLRKLHERYGDDKVASDPFVMAYAQVHLWKQAVEAAGAFTAEAVLNHVVGQSIVGPGGPMEIQTNHHIKKPTLIGRAMVDGQFEVVWRSDYFLNATPWLGVEAAKLPVEDLIMDVMGQYPNTVHLNWELQQEITKRKQTEESLEESREKFRGLSEAAFEAIFISENGVCLEQNTAARKMFGYSDKEAIGRLCKEWVISEDRELVMQNMLTGYEEPYEVTAQCKDGSTFPARVQAKMIQYHGKSVRVTSLRNITRRKQAEEAIRKSEEALRRRAEEMNALQQTVLGITSSISLSDLLQSIVERATGLLGASSGGLYLTEPEKQRVRCVVSYKTAKDFTGTTLAYGEGAAGYVAQTGEPLLIDDYRKWSGKAEVFENEQSFQAIISAPLIWQGEVLGVIHMLREGKRGKYIQEELELLTRFADHAAVAVQNARLYESLQKSEERYRNIYERVDDIIYETDFHGHFTGISPSTEKHTGYKPEEIIGKDVESFFDNPDEYNTLLAKMARKGTINDFEIRLRKKSGEVSDVSVTAHTVFDADGNPIKTEGILRDITERKQAEEREREQRALAEALRDTAEALNSSLELDEILTKILDKVGDVVKYDTISITWIEDNKVRFMKLQGFEAELEQWFKKQIFNVDDFAIIQQVVESREPVVVSDTKSDPRWVFIPATSWIQSHIETPVVVNGKVVAIINLDSKDPGFYTAAHAISLQTFANQVAIAVQNAMLYEEVQNRATLDELTRLYNRRGFFEICRREVGRLQRFSRPFSALFFDIDHFKQFNDHYSYQVGDLVLQQVAETLQQNVREIDVVGRYGGEEMVALLPETNPTNAKETAERLRKAIENLRVPSEHGLLGVTVSIGVATLIPIQGQTIAVDPKRQAKILDDLIAKAGEALHIAKQEGRNRVEAYS